MYLSSFAAFEQLSPAGLLLKMKSIDLKLFAVSTYIICYDLKSRLKSFSSVQFLSNIMDQGWPKQTRPGTGRFEVMVKKIVTDDSSV